MAARDRIFLSGPGFNNWVGLVWDRGTGIYFYTGSF